MTGAPDPERKPRDDELDVYGLTHPGKVRLQNQDHYLLATVHRRVEVVRTSLPPTLPAAFGDDRLAILAMVADGVGSSSDGEQASATAVETALQYVSASMRCFQGAPADDAELTDLLQDAALQAHAAVKARAEARGDGGTMATTLTVWLGVWPWYYLLQVGDSRCYLYRDGALTQVSRDQTLAEDLVDQGVFTRAVAERSRLAHVLSSAIGGEQATPVVTRLRADWQTVHLLCSDGLTKHVRDDRIAEVLGGMTSARQACEQLLQDALDGGGSDNVTIVVGRAVPRGG
jgi:protein phosphatase